MLPGGGEPERRRFACRLAEKAYRLKHSVHIAAGDAAAERELDELLWTFRDGSFVPHELTRESNTAPEAPVTIGRELPANRTPFLLINLSTEQPERWEASNRVAEIVAADDESRALCRRRYARYRELGHTPTTHEL